MCVCLSIYIYLFFFYASLKFGGVGGCQNYPVFKHFCASKKSIRMFLCVKIHDYCLSKLEPCAVNNISDLSAKHLHIEKKNSGTGHRNLAFYSENI